MRVKIDKADAKFSQYIRTRDGRCVRCYSPVRFNDKGLPTSHHNSHYFGRSRESTRFDELNCDTLCHGCHQVWGSTDRESYRQFKLAQLGQKEFDLLTIRAGTLVKKDRAMALIIAQELLKSLNDPVQR